MHTMLILIKNERKFVSLVFLPCKVSGGGRNGKQGRESRCLDSLFVGHEFQQTEPAVTAVSGKAAADRLRIESHLGNGFTRTVLRH